MIANQIHVVIYSFCYQQSVNCPLPFLPHFIIIVPLYHFAINSTHKRYVISNWQQSQPKHRPPPPPRHLTADLSLN